MALTTYRDAVEHLLDVFDITSTPDRISRNVRRAIDYAYRDLPYRARWSYYDRRIVLNTVAEQTSSTITYDHTGGTYERELTLAAGTWPTNADQYRIIIAGTHYDIDSRESDTVLTLKENSNPGADVAAGTSYTLYRDTYDLPSNFRRMGTVWDVDNEHEMTYLTGDEQMSLSSIAYDTPDTPWHVTIRNSGNDKGTMALVFIPPPSTARQYNILYEAAPRDLNIDEYKMGTVTTSGTTCTLTSGTFPEECAGSVIRFSTTTTYPTNKYGNVEDGDNLYYAQRTIRTRTSDTVVVLDSALPANLTGVAYTLSDPIDIEAGAMLTAFYRAAEAEYAKLATLNDQDNYAQRAEIAVRRALEADQRATGMPHRVGYDRFSRVTVTTDSD